MAGWVRTARYGSRMEMEQGVGWVAAAGWLLQSATACPDGSYEVLYSRLSATSRGTAPGRAQAGRRLPLAFRSRR